MVVANRGEHHPCCAPYRKKARSAYTTFALGDTSPPTTVANSKVSIDIIDINAVQRSIKCCKPTQEGRDAPAEAINAGDGETTLAQGPIAILVKPRAVRNQFIRFAKTAQVSKPCAGMTNQSNARRRKRKSWTPEVLTICPTLDERPDLLDREIEVDAAIELKGEPQ
jgi:hypothetical protein